MLWRSWEKPPEGTAPQVRRVLGKTCPLTSALLTLTLTWGPELWALCRPRARGIQASELPCEAMRDTAAPTSPKVSRLKVITEGCQGQ